MKSQTGWGVLALLATLSLPTLVSAEDKISTPGLSREDALKHAKNVAKRTQAVLSFAELVDELTKTKGELTVKSAGRTPVAEKTFFGVEFLVSGVEFEDSVTNKLFGTEVPGRRIAVKICLDCNVECRVDVSNIKITRHEEYNNTVVVVVPKLELIGRLPEGKEYTYEVDYGNLRAKWIDSDEARVVRKEMVAKAALKAAQEFGKSEVMVEFRKGFKAELGRLLKTTLPEGHRIEIKFGDE